MVIIVPQDQVLRRVAVRLRAVVLQEAEDRARETVVVEVAPAALPAVQLMTDPSPIRPSLLVQLSVLLEGLPSLVLESGSSSDIAETTAITSHSQYNKTHQPTHPIQASPN